MINFDKPFEYDPNTGKWTLELQKAPKLFCAQCGVKFTLDPGVPTGETGDFFKSNNKSGMEGSTLNIQAFDNLSGWTSVVSFDFPTLIEKLIELMPEGKVAKNTICLAEHDRKVSGEHE